MFQLVVTGSQALFSSRGVIHSRKIFHTREAAEAFGPEFALICLTPVGEHDLYYLASIESIHIVELEGVD